MAEPCLLATAAEWHERMLGDPDPATRRAFAAWRMASPAHIRAYERMRDARMDAAALADAGPLLALRAETAARTGRIRRSGRVRRAGIAAGVLMLAGGPLAAWSISRWTAPPAAVQPADQSVRTAIGQRSRLALPDGSQVTLDTASRLTMRGGAGARQLAVDGQGWFHLRPSPTPFVIVAGGVRMTTQGGDFNVRTDGGTVRVLAVAGRATAGGADGGAAAAIGPGELFTARGGEATIRTLADTGSVTSWRGGTLTFRDARLAEVAAELNRYRRRPIRLADPRVADLRISGAFGTAESPAFVGALTAGFPVTVKADRDTDVLLASR